MDFGQSGSNWVLSALLVAFTLVLGAVMYWQDFRLSPVPYVSRDMTMLEAAQSNEIPVKVFVHELARTEPSVLELPQSVAMKYLAVSEDSLQRALARVLRERATVLDMIKYLIMALWISAALLFVLARKQIRSIRLVTLALSVIMFGVAMGASPNPMEAVVRFLKMLKREQIQEITVAVSLILFTAFSLLGTKLICGWSCPLGSLQELVFAIPFFERRRAFKCPFSVGLVVRLAVFAVCFLLFFRIGTGVRSVVLYHHVDYFGLYRFGDMPRVALYSLPLLLLLSFLVYRPFCQLICPFGLYAWVLETFAVNKPRIIEARCTHCEKCVSACPTEAMKGIYEKKREHLLPDCWSCGEGDHFASSHEK